MHGHKRARVLDVGGRRLAVAVARGPLARLRGVLGRGELAPGEGMLIPRCRSVHTIGLRRPIDVVFLSWPPTPAGMVEIVAIRAAIPPCRVVGVRARAAALELRAGEAERLGLAVGQNVTLGEAPVPECEEIFRRLTKVVRKSGLMKHLRRQTDTR